MQKYAWKSWLVGMAIALLGIGGLMWQGEANAAGATAPATRTPLALPQGFTMGKRELSKPATEGKFRVVRGKMSITGPSGKAHDLTLEIKQAKVKGDGDLVVTGVDTTANLTETVTVSNETGVITFKFSTLTIVWTLNPDESFSIEGKKYSLDEAADYLVEKAHNVTNAELCFALADALLVDPQASLATTSEAASKGKFRTGVRWGRTK